MLKQQLVFIGQTLLLYPIAVLWGGLMVPKVGAQPTVIGFGPVVLALLFGAAIGAGLTTLVTTIRATAPLVGTVPAGFVLISVVSRGSVSKDLYVVSGANEGGLDIAIVTLPALFYVGDSVGALAVTRIGQKSQMEPRT